jgi:ATP/maltotriose-dependent transcriptional regulator MalT
MAHLKVSHVMPIRTSVFGRLAHAQGAVDRAGQVVQEALPNGPAALPDDTHAVYVHPLLRLAVSLALDAGDLQSARAWLEAYDRWLTWMGARLGQAEGALLWAQHERAAGNPSGAAQHAERALAAASDPRQPLALLAARRLLGELDTAAGRYDTAEQHLAASLALADACAAPYERAQSLLALAELRLAQNEPILLAQTLADMRAICEPLRATPLLERGAALTRRADRGANPANLTERELDVLGLMVAGLTNREIAQRLLISPYTAKRHVGNILHKLGVRTRTAAVRFAIDHGLAVLPDSARDDAPPG